jgi:hypothetical protein
MLVAVVAALAVLGVVRAVPTLARSEPGVADVEPGMLTASSAVRGVVTLGGGLTVSLYSDGLRVQRQGVAVFQTVRIASLVSAGFGRLDGTGGNRREQLTSTLDHVRFTSLDLSGEGVATYSGDVYDASRSLPLTLTARRAGGQRVDLTITVPGADLLVLHVWRLPGMRGIPPRLPDRSLAGSAWWLQPLRETAAATTPAFTTGRGATVGVDSTAPTAVDLRQAGRGEIHVWAPVLRLSVW